MCNKREFNSKVKKYRELKEAKEAIEAEMSELRTDIVDYVVDHGEPSNESGSTICVKSNTYKVLYITTVKENLDKAKLKEVLGDGYFMYVNSTPSHRLCIN